MKRFCFSILLLAMVSVGFVSLLSLLHFGDGAVKYISMSLTSAMHRKNIGVSEAPERPDAEYLLASENSESRALTAEDVSCIYVNGERFDLPMKLGELPEGFSYSVYDVKEDKSYKEKTGKTRYNHGLWIYYNGAMWCWGTCYSDNGELDTDNAEITTYLFLGVEETPLFPSTIFAGFDVKHTDFKLFNDIYGSGHSQYGRNHFTVPCGDKTCAVRIYDSGDGGEIPVIVYYDDTESYSGLLCFYDREYRLPEGYVPPEKTEDSDTPPPEGAERIEEILSGLTICGRSVHLPCTLDELLYAFGDGAYIELGTTKPDADDTSDEDLYYIEQYLYFTSDNSDTEQITVRAAFRFGENIGDAAVLRIMSVGTDTFENVKLKGVFDDEGNLDESCPYDFKYDEENRVYRLTDYKYNNIEFSNSLDMFRGYFEVSVQYDNTEKISAE